MLGQNQNAPEGCEGPENLGIKGTVVFVAIYLNSSCLRGSRTRRLGIIYRNSCLRGSRNLRLGTCATSRWRWVAALRTWREPPAGSFQCIIVIVRRRERRRMIENHAGDMT